MKEKDEKEKVRRTNIRRKRKKEQTVDRAGQGGARKEVCTRLCTRERERETLALHGARARTPVTAFSNTMRLVRLSLAWRLATANRRGTARRPCQPRLFLLDSGARSYRLPFFLSFSLPRFARRRRPMGPTTSPRLAPSFPSLFLGPETPPSPSSPTTISTRVPTFAGCMPPVEYPPRRDSRWHSTRTPISLFLPSLSLIVLPSSPSRATSGLYIYPRIVRVSSSSSS